MEPSWVRPQSSRGAGLTKGVAGAGMEVLPLALRGRGSGWTPWTVSFSSPGLGGLKPQKPGETLPPIWRHTTNTPSTNIPRAAQPDGVAGLPEPGQQEEAGRKGA